MPAKLISERKTNLALSYQELLTATVRLRFNRQSAPKPDVFRAHMHEAYRLSTLEAENNGYQPEYVRMAGQAVIAFLDETVAVSGNTAFSGWWIIRRSGRMPLMRRACPTRAATWFWLQGSRFKVRIVGQPRTLNPEP